MTLPLLVAPGARLEIVSNTAGDTMAAMLGLCEHVQAGEHDPRGWFSDPASEASSTWWVAKTGLLVQYAHHPRVRMWAQGAGNSLYASVETEGEPSEPLTDAQLDTLASLYAWAHRHNELRWPLFVADKPGTAGFVWHGAGGAAWGGHTGCPGELRKSQRTAVIARALKLLGGRPSPGHPSTPPSTPRMPAWYTRVLMVQASRPLQIGRDVGRVQQIIGMPDSSQDDVYGPQTAAAVRRWQTVHNVGPADGVVGPATAGRMGP